ncbi:MAG: hypothetical protein KDD94_12500 [Calditrichaeota bacterium]|nr:hypothetical protein [Calditrichota bacterium]
MILAILFLIQNVPMDSGIVFYNNSRVYFRNMNNQTAVVKNWETLKTPTDQVINVTYTKKQDGLYNLKMTDQFRIIYQQSNETMKSAEKLLRQRQFKESLDSLQRVEELNPYIPYLYSNLFYVLVQLAKDSEAINIVQKFEQKRNFLSNLEQSVFYYDQYDYWRNRYDKSRKLGDLDNAYQALNASYTLRPDTDKLRLLNNLKAKLEAVKNDQQ